MTGIRKVILLMNWLLLLGCNGDDPAPGTFLLTSAFAGTQQLEQGTIVGDVALDQSIALNFSRAIDRSTIAAIVLLQGATPLPADLSFSSQDKTVVIFPKAVLLSNTAYSLNITNTLKAADGATFDGAVLEFKTVTAKLVLTGLSI